MKSDVSISYVITNPDKAVGRGQKVLPNSFAHAAAEMDVRVEKPQNGDEITSLLQQNPVDLVLTVAYGQLIREPALSIPPMGWLNIHFSLLPAWRGAAPVQYALMNGETQTGITVFRLDAGMDTGPVFASWTTSINSEETTSTLLASLAQSAAEHIGEILKQVTSGVAPVAQSDVGVSYAPKLKKADGKIDLHSPSKVALAKIRALGENPGAFVSFRRQRLGITRAEISYASHENTQPGELQATKNELILFLADGAIRLLGVIPQGKQEMSGADFARGARINAGELCE